MMTQTEKKSGADAKLREALAADASSARLQAALSAGTHPDPAFIEVLVARCAIEPDFYVRDMLTWALIRHDRAEVTRRVLTELASNVPQARSQALHTLSKIADPDTWPAITAELLHDENDDVARTAWRAAAGLVPEGQEVPLAEILATQFGRGDRDVQLSLSRAFADIGPAAAPVVERAKAHGEDAARLHAIATERIMADPEEGFDAAIAEARKAVALLAAPRVDDLVRVRSSEPTDWRDVLRTIALMRGFDADDASERQRLALSLGTSEQRDIRSIVDAALTETDPNAAGALDWSIARIGHSALPLIIGALESPEDHLRHRAAEILSRMRTPEASHALAECIRHPDVVVRGHAALARGQRGEADAIPALFELVAAGHRDVEASDMLAALAAQPSNEDGILRLIGAAFSASGAAERLRLTATLADIPSPAADAVLAELTADHDHRVALTATSILRSRTR
ncbi:MAG: HEAT repeat domain-containing protein [Microbacterium sp.]|uniref:HEAT repeat domain-containing protein n=1 Tax=Microbacterium sp. TaxID=51671 RepID=UPI001AD06AE7|nr:HEAT repeat domain-containing protein [Microbacterium sp.]MBN9176995.1 HEAT repeat domain-containing protein [Microbacterium sp.]